MSTFPFPDVPGWYMELSAQGQEDAMRFIHEHDAAKAELAASEALVSALQEQMARMAESFAESVKEWRDKADAAESALTKETAAHQETKRQLDDLATRFNVEELADLACVEIRQSEELGKACAALDAFDWLAFSNQLADSFELARNHGREADSSIPAQEKPR